MIFVTGDVHGFLSFERLQEFAKTRELCRQDFVIILGDCGAVWDNESLPEFINAYESLPFSVLFLDGNHENFDILNSYPVEQWAGGKVHRIGGLIHLMRGQVFSLEDKKIFTFGGAESVDKYLRTEGISWWAAEVPSAQELQEARINLAAHSNKVDYILTHATDERTLCYPIMAQYHYKSDTVCSQLNEFEENVDYGHWYFGHYHIDAKINYRKTAVYEMIIKL